MADDFLNNPNLPELQNIHFSLIVHYIPQELYSLFLINEFGFDADFQKTKAAIYGSSDVELMTELSKFRNFAGCLHRFGPNCRGYDLWPSSYKLTYRETDRLPRPDDTPEDTPINQICLYQQDLMTVMMKEIPDRFFYRNELMNNLIRDLCSQVLKDKEENLPGSFTFSTYLDNQLHELRRLMRILGGREIKFKLKKESIGTVWTELNRYNFGELTSLRAMIILRDMDTYVPFKDNINFYKKVIRSATMIVRIWRRFEQRNRRWFQPDDRTEFQNSHVRVFTQGQAEFVLVEDAYLAIEQYKRHFFVDENLTDYLLSILREVNFELEGFEGRFVYSLATMPLREIQELIRRFVRYPEAPEEEDPEGMINFVPYDIQRTKHLAVYIPYSVKKHCILAGDLLLELCRYLISVKSVFQNQKRNVLGTIDFYFSTIDAFQIMEAKSPFFIDADWVIVYKGKLRTVLEDSSIPEGPVQVKPILRGKFTLQDIKNQLALFNLSECFPNIERFVDLRQNYFEYVTTSNMYTALEHCQLLALFEQLPHRYEWLKRQQFANTTPFDDIVYEDSELKSYTSL